MENMSDTQEESQIIHLFLKSNYGRLPVLAKQDLTFSFLVVICLFRTDFPKLYCLSARKKVAVVPYTSLCSLRTEIF